MNHPRISVIMPVYNAERYLALAIESILHQSFVNFEYIIIDDGSVDGSWDIISLYAEHDERIIARRNDKNKQICEALNYWVEIARGEYIARMDSDDISFSNRLQLQIDFLDSHPDVWILWGAMEIINENGEVFAKREYNESDAEIRKKIFRYSPFCHPVVMMRKKILKKAGGYDARFIYAEDYDLYFRIGLYSKFANLPNKLIQYRMFLGNTTNRKYKEMEQKTIQIRKRAEISYGYTMTLMDRMYNFLHSISRYVIPQKMKIWLFNTIRNS